MQEVDGEVTDVAGENSRYTLRFVDAGDPSLVSRSSGKRATGDDVDAGRRGVRVCFFGSLQRDYHECDLDHSDLDAGFSPGVGKLKYGGPMRLGPR